MTGCTPGTSDSEADSEKELLASRDRVIGDVTALLTDLTGAVPARLTFTQGNYDSCTSDLKGPTGYRYTVNGRLDLDRVGSAADLDNVAATLDAAGYRTQQANEISVEGRRDDIDFVVSIVRGQPFLLFHSRSDECFEIGRDRADKYNVDKDPITLD